MKALMALIFFIFFAVTLHGQSFNRNFLGDDCLSYMGVYFKLMDDPESNLDFMFYTRIEDCQNSYSPDVAYPDPNHRSNTVIDSLSNRIFLVEKILNPSGEDFKGLVTVLNKPIFVLKDTTTKQVIYFRYDWQNEYMFPFLTTTILYDANVLCTSIERNVDEFTGEIDIHTPIILGSDISPVIFYKIIKKAKSAYYLGLRTTESDLSVNGDGVIILFADGSKWVKSTKIEVKADHGGFAYTAFMSLTLADLAIFSKKKIAKFRLYIYDQAVNPADATKWTIWSKCIKDLK